jgi:hypothetical protein
MNSAPSLSSGMLAGLLLAARAYLQSLDLPCPTNKAILHATGASRSRAYVCRHAILGAIDELSCNPGRPQGAVTEHDAHLTREFVAFLLAHPGAAYVRGQRRCYSPAFRRFVIDVRRRYPTLSTAALARSLQVPAATLCKWLDITEPPPAPAKAPSEHSLVHGSIPPRQLVWLFDAWKCWRGSFSGFCSHVQTSLGTTLGRTALTRLLQRLGMRRLAGAVARLSSVPCVNRSSRSFRAPSG